MAVVEVINDKGRTDYHATAQKWADEHKLTFTATFLRHGQLFIEDKEDDTSRDVYRLTLRRKGDHRGNRDTKFSVTFGQSIAASKIGEKPTVYDMLTCIEKYPAETFESWCLDYGYNHDSRKAESIYRRCKAQWKRVQEFFTQDEIDDLQNIN